MHRYCCWSAERLRNKGDRLAFISSSLELREGADLYVGSSNAARTSAQEVTSLLGVLLLNLQPFGNEDVGMYTESLFPETPGIYAP
ncbi:MAG: hypothetical protein R2741_01180 [Methanolobus sp.]